MIVAIHTLVDFTISQIFPHEPPETIWKLLSRYRHEDPWNVGADEEGRAMVHLACLLLCGGSQEALGRYADAANLDVRDVLGPAGYPGFVDIVAHEYAACKQAQQPRG